MQPVYLDLHLHLDGSLSPRCVHELAALSSESVPEGEELLRLLRAPADCQNLGDYLRCFDFPLTLLQTPEALSLAVFTLLGELLEQGFIYAEVRFAPQRHTLGAMSQRTAVAAAVEGLERFFAAHGRDALSASLILCCMRDAGDSENLETLRIASEFLGRGVCGCDLAGAEALYPTEGFRSLFSEAQALNIPITIHAGEASGADSVLTAIECGAGRIGHGVRSCEDEEVLSLLVSRGITLELCPTSNLNTRVFEDIGSFPLPRLISRGVTVTVNSDNMSVSNTTAARELELVRRTFRLDDEQVRRLLLSSCRAAFAPEELRERLEHRVNRSFSR